WIESGGQGVIYSYSVTRRGTPTPYCIAYVTLDEGPTMMTNIVDCDLDQVRIGQRVQVVFKPTGDASGSTPPVAMFRPV
ncbi:MAG: DNA-binding protein, partial [Caulobacteraceae bacterium]|nr:DNA-binding protein [Caulobacteraceae bacterium]